MEGIADFFRAVASGRQIRDGAQAKQQAAFIDQDYRAGRADKALTDARIARDTELQRLEAETALAEFMPPAQARSAGALMRGGFGKVTQVADAIGQFGQNAGLDMARAAAERGDIAGMNPGLALYGGKPVSTTSISGGTAFNPLAAPSQPLQATPVGESMIRENMGSAAASNALAGLRSEQAAYVAPVQQARVADLEARARKGAALAEQREQDNAAMAMPIDDLSKPAGGLMAASVEPSAAAGTISPDIERAIRELGPARASTEYGLPNVSTQQDFDALPSGAYFFDFEDGQIYRKP